jgi:hypothetical protein
MVAFCRIRKGVACVLRQVALLLGWSTSALAQSGEPTGQVKSSVDRVLTLMAFTVVPDLTASVLSFDGGDAGQARLGMTQIGGGTTLKSKYPIYLEGSLAYMNYDPSFVIPGYSQEQSSANWSSLSATGGVGWDFEVLPNLVFRPILNVAYGHLSSDLQLPRPLLRGTSNPEIDFLDNGTLNAYGLGGSLMLDYTLEKMGKSVDLELRYTHITLKPFNSQKVVSGSALAETVSAYGRYRAPIGVTFLDRPVRYVLEAASTVYLGDQRDALGFNYLSSIGAGIELDWSATNDWISKSRIVGRYAFGENVQGFAISVALSF